MWTAGQVIGLIQDIPTCADLINRIEKEAVETLNAKIKLFVEEQPEPDIRGKPMEGTSGKSKL